MDEAVLVVPARSELLSLVRSVVASLAARQGFSYDAIEDLRIAVSEAATFLLEASAPGARLELRVSHVEEGVAVGLSTDAPAGAWPPVGAQRSLAWQVLSALTDEAALGQDADAPALQLMKRGAPAG